MISDNAISKLDLAALVPKHAMSEKSREFWRIRWRIDKETLALNRKSDGMHLLLTNDRTPTDAQVPKLTSVNRPSKNAVNRPKACLKSHRPY